MEILLGALLVVALAALIVVWVILSNRIEEMSTDLYRAEHLDLVNVLRDITLELVALNEKPQPDFTPFTIAQEAIHALNARMDTINDDQHELRTRVENGSGRRTLSL